jgi:hypothetical protein
MSQSYVVRHWKGQDAVERVITEKRLVAENVLDALLLCVPLSMASDWWLNFPVWDYASLSNPEAPEQEADYWEAELSAESLSEDMVEINPVLN